MCLFLSNARAYYFVWAAMVLLCVQMRRGRKVTLRTFLLLALVIVAVLFSLRALASSALFQNFGFISFQFDSLSDLLNGANTQGRNLVFEEQMERVASSTLASQLFGNGYTGDRVFVNGATYGAHSLYVGTLFNLGICGLGLMVAFLGILTYRAAKLENIKTRYLVVSLSATFLMAGLSVDVLQYTANSWMPFFFLGYANSLWSQGVSDRLRSFSQLSSVPPSSDPHSSSSHLGVCRS